MRMEVVEECGGGGLLRDVEKGKRLEKMGGG